MQSPDQFAAVLLQNAPRETMNPEGRVPIPGCKNGPARNVNDALFCLMAALQCKPDIATEKQFPELVSKIFRYWQQPPRS